MHWPRFCAASKACFFPCARGLLLLTITRDFANALLDRDVIAAFEGDPALA